MQASVCLCQKLCGPMRSTATGVRRPRPRPAARPADGGTADRRPPRWPLL